MVFVVSQLRRCRQNAWLAFVIGAVLLLLGLPEVPGSSPWSTTAFAASDLPNDYQLPFPQGETWYFTGGPHNYNESPARPWSSIDIAPPEVIKCPGGQTPLNRWVVAAKAGTVVESSQGLIAIDHGDGWRSYYSHVATAGRTVAKGSKVQQNDPLGHPSCEAEPHGSTTGVHVHFALFKVGTGLVDIDGSSLSGWTIHEADQIYQGSMTRDGSNPKLASTGRSGNDIYNFGAQAEILQTTPTQVLTFLPAAVDGDVRDGDCFVHSIVVSRSDAFRCGVAGVGLVDPCFQVSDSDNLVCNIDPVDQSQAFMLRPESALPDDPVSTSADPTIGIYALELSDGTRCIFTSGPPLVTRDNHFIFNYCPPRISENPLNLWSVVDLQPGQTWIAKKVRVAQAVQGTAISDLAIMESQQLSVATVWR
jgi:hypothetical protein